MTAKQALSELKKISDPRARENWIRFGIRTPDEYYGVAITKLRDFAKLLKKNHAMSLELWSTAVHDAKLLATMIEKPKKVTEEQVNAQVKQIYTCDLTNTYCSSILGKTPFGYKYIGSWSDQEDHEMLKRAAFALLCNQAKEDAEAPDGYFEKYLKQIERELQAERNWVKEMMNYALIAIGTRNPALNEKAVNVRKKIGAVMVDYGDTSCKTIDALSALRKPGLKFRHA